MSTAAPSRIMFRHTRYVARQTTRRHASTTEAAKDTAAKSKETASNTTSKTSHGLSRVTSSAAPAVSGAAQRVSKLIGNIGGRTGRMISFVQCKPGLVFRSQSHTAEQSSHLVIQSFVHATMNDFPVDYGKIFFPRSSPPELHIIASFADW